MSAQLLYFADPMCSWCWGFTPVIEAVKKTHQLPVKLILGGLRPGTTEPISASLRSEILHHWHQVQARSGQFFLFEDALPDGFIYDTEPPCRAVVTMAELRPRETFQYFKNIQRSFYTTGLDVTQTEHLVSLAAAFDVNDETFQQTFDSPEIRQKTLAHFSNTRYFGIRGFPALIMQHRDNWVLLSHGFSDFETVSRAIMTELGAP